MLMENVFLQQELVHRVPISTDNLVFHIPHAQMEEHGTVLLYNAHVLKILSGMAKAASHVVSDRFILIVSGALAQLELISMVHNVCPFRTTNANLSRTPYGMEQGAFVYQAISSKVKHASVSDLLLMVNVIPAIASLILVGSVISASVMMDTMKIMDNAQL